MFNSSFKCLNNVVVVTDKHDHNNLSNDEFLSGEMSVDGGKIEFRLTFQSYKRLAHLVIVQEMAEIFE